MKAAERRSRDRGAVALAAALCAVLVAAAAAAAGGHYLALAVGEHAQSLADAAAHAAEVAAGPEPGDLSRLVQAHPDACVYAQPGSGTPALATPCVVPIAAALGVVRDGDTRAVLQELVLHPDPRFARDGAGSGPVMATAVVAVPLRLPRCGGPPPPLDERTLCWVRAISVAEATL